MYISATLAVVVCMSSSLEGDETLCYRGPRERLEAVRPRRKTIQFFFMPAAKSAKQKSRGSSQHALGGVPQNVVEGVPYRPPSSVGHDLPLAGGDRPARRRP